MSRWHVAVVLGAPLLATVGSGGQESWIRPWWHLVAAVAIGSLLLLRRIEVPRLATIPWACLIGWFALGTVLAPAPGPARDALWEAVLVGGLLLSSARALDDRTIWVWRGAGAVHGLVAIYQVVALEQDRVASTFLNPNHLGGWCAVVVAAGLAAWPLGRVARFAAAALLLPAVLAVLLSGSRGAQLALVAAVAFLVGRLVRRAGPRVRGLAVAGFVVLLAAAAWSQAGRLAGSDPFRYGRIAIWRASLDLVAERPLLGTGPGQLSDAARRHAFPDGDGPLLYDRSFALPHSDLLRPAVELGLPAAIALLWLVVAARTRPEATPQRAALIAVGTQACVDDPSAWPALALTAAVLIGSALRSRTVVLQPATRGALLTALFLMVLAIDGRGLWLDRALPDGARPRRGWLAGATARDFAGEARGRVAAGPGLDRLLRRATEIAPTDAWLHSTRATAALADGELDDASYATAREALERAARLDPEDARHRWALAQLEARGCLERYRDLATCRRALARYDEAGSRSPFDARIAVDHADFARTLGDLERARRESRRAVELEPESPVAWLCRARLWLAVGERERAHEAFERARAVHRPLHPEASDFERDLLQVEPAAWPRLQERLKPEGEVDG